MSLEVLRLVKRNNARAFWESRDELDEPLREGVPLKLWRALK